MVLPGEALDAARQRLEQRARKLLVTGRYHVLPVVLANDYRVEDEVLGTGINGQVFAACGHLTGKKYAVKELLTHDLSPESLEELVNEVEISLAMDHPNVIRLVDVYESTTKLTMVTEYMSGGDIFDRIGKSGKYSEEQAGQICRQMLLAINYLHTQHIAHRDVKLDNFLYMREDDDQLKLIDFGFGKIWEPDTYMARALGTLSYVAPEVINRSYTLQCDIWSFGVCAFILLFGIKPFRDPFCDREDVIIESIIKGQYKVTERLWNSVSSDAQDFVKSLLVVDPDIRFSAAQALKHPWIVNNTLERRTSIIEPSVAKALATFGRMSALRRASLRMAALSMTTNDREKVRDVFLALDADGSGALSFEEIRKVLATQCCLADEEIVKVFDAIQIEQDGQIHHSDFLAAMAATNVQLKDDLLKESFRRFDVEGDGFISLDNMKNVYGESLSGHPVEKLFLDAGLVRNRRISYTDWADYVTRRASRQSTQFTAEVVEQTLPFGGEGCCSPHLDETAPSQYDCHENSVLEDKSTDHS